MIPMVPTQRHEAEVQYRALTARVASADRMAQQLDARGDRLGAGRVRWEVMLERQRAKLLAIMLESWIH